MKRKLKKWKWLLCAVASLLLTVSVNTATKKHHFFSVIDFSTSGESFEKPSDLPKGEKIAVQFSKPIDGDTSEFLLNQQPIKVRYLLIDTPETKKPGTPQQPFGKEASERTEQLIQNRNRIRPGRHKRQIRPCSSLCIY